MNLQVLFICSGNTCRSPLAEVIAGQMFPRHCLDFCSGGLQAGVGSPASRGARVAARERGLSLAGHRSRKVGPSELVRPPWVIGMTRGLVARILEIRPAQATGKVGLLGAPGMDLCRGGLAPEAAEVADPFGGGLPEYRTAVGLIEDFLRGWSDVFDRLTPGKEGPP